MKTVIKNILIKLAIIFLIMATTFLFIYKKHKTKIMIENPGRGNDIRPAIVKALENALDGDTIVFQPDLYTISSAISCNIKVMLYGIDSTVIYKIKH